MSFIDKNLQVPDINQYSDEDYNKLIQNYKVALHPNISNMNYEYIDRFGVQLSYAQVDGLLQDTSKDVDEEVISLLIGYMNYQATIKQPTWNIEYVGLNVSKVGPASVDFTQFQRYEIQKISKSTHLICFINFKDCWFCFLLDISKLSAFIICPSSKISSESNTIVQRVVKQGWGYELKQKVQAISGRGGKEESDIAIILQLLFNTFISGKAETVAFYQVFQYKKEHLLDWLLLRLGTQELSFIYEEEPDNKIKNPNQSYSKLLANISDLSVNSYNNKVQYRAMSPILQGTRISKYSNESFPSIQSSKIVEVYSENQIGQTQFKQLLEELKQEIIQEEETPNGNDKKTIKFLKNKIDSYGGVLEQQQGDKQIKYLRRSNSKKQINLKVSNLNQMLKDYTNSLKNDQEYQDETKNKEFQNALSYYYQNDPQQYHQLMDLYVGGMKEQIFEGMGLGQKTIQKSTGQQFQAKFNLTYNNSTRVNRIHKFNVSQSQHQLASPQSIGFNQIVVEQNTQEPKQKLKHDSKQSQRNPDIIASRYNRQIGKLELENLNKNVMSEGMLGFFIKYLEEKQQDSRIFFTSTNFYKILAVQGDGTCDYQVVVECYIYMQRAKQFTRFYIGKGNTIFDKFHMMVIPVLIKKLDYQVICVDFKKQEFKHINTIRSSLSVQKTFNPIVESVFKFIQEEYMEKMMRKLDTLKYKFKEVEGEPHNTQKSCIVAAKIIYNIFSNRELDEQNLDEFRYNLTSLIRMISMTQNKRNELNGRIATFPL